MEDAVHLEWWNELQNAHRKELCIVMCVFVHSLEIIGRRQDVCKSAKKFHAKSCKVALTLYARQSE